MSETLYAANVEEYRLRTLLNSFMLAFNFSGPCATIDPNDPQRSCTAVVGAIAPLYLQSLQRYSADVAMMHAIAVNATRANFDADALALLAHIQKSSNCNDPATIKTAATIRPDGSDCPFRLTILETKTRANLGTVQYNAYTLLIPGIHPSPKGLDTENAALWAPLDIDVVACAKVAPLIPSFWKYKALPFQAIARSAATSVMFVEDWFEPGALLKPYTNPQQHFQDIEHVVASPLDNTTDWYATDFGGNYATVNKAKGGFGTSFTSAEMSARVGWWNAIPRKLSSTAPAVDLSKACPP